MSDDTLLEYLTRHYSRPGLRTGLETASIFLPGIDHRIWPLIGPVIDHRSPQAETADVYTAVAWARLHRAYQVPRTGRLRLGEALRQATAGDENLRRTLHTHLVGANPATLGNAVLRGIDACRAAGQVPDWRALRADLRSILVFRQDYQVKRRWGADMFSAVPVRTATDSGNNGAAQPADRAS